MGRWLTYFQWLPYCQLCFGLGAMLLGYVEESWRASAGGSSIWPIHEEIPNPLPAQIGSFSGYLGGSHGTRLSWILYPQGYYSWGNDCC